MTDDKMKEDEKEDVPQGTEGLPSAEARADDDQQGNAKKKKKKKQEAELTTLPTAETPGILDPPPPSKLKQLKMTEEEWRQMAQEALTRSQAASGVLQGKWGAIFARETQTAKAMFDLDGVQFDPATFEPKKFTQEQADALVDGDYATEGECSDCDEEIAAEQEEGNAKPEEAPDEDDEDEAEDLDDTKASDARLALPADPVEDEASAADVGGSDEVMEDAGDAEDVEDGPGSASDAGEDETGAAEDVEDGPGSASDAGEDEAGAAASDGSDEVMEDAGDAEYVEDGSSSAGDADEEQTDDQSGVYKAIALAEGVITNIDEAYEDDVEDMKD